MIETVLAAGAAGMLLQLAKVQACVPAPEAGHAGREVLYLLTSLSGCEFQPYQMEG